MHCTNLPVGLACYYSEFGGSAAMSPIAESSTKNCSFVGAFPRELGAQN